MHTSAHVRTRTHTHRRAHSLFYAVFQTYSAGERAAVLSVCLCHLSANSFRKWLRLLSLTILAAFLLSFTSHLSPTYTCNNYYNKHPWTGTEFLSGYRVANSGFSSPSKSVPPMTRADTAMCNVLWVLI